MACVIEDDIDGLQSYFLEVQLRPDLGLQFF